MRTVQMTLDEDLVHAVDRVVKDLGTNRSAFARTALQQAIATVNLRRLEEKHRLGYQRKPAVAGEFDLWEKEQKWGDE